MTSRNGIALALAFGLASSACSGEPIPSGLTEPLYVHGAQFISGALPGTPAPAGQNPKLVSPTVTVSQEPTLPNSPIVGVVAGQSDRVFSGHATPTGASLGVRLKDAGSGYWLVPLGAPDPMDGNDLQWNGLTVDFPVDASARLRDLLFVAMDTEGRAGTQFDQPFCIDSAIPDNRNACTPTRQPPALVVSLSWDTPVDLDLKVVTPDSTVIDAKHPSIGGAEPGSAPPPGPDTTGAYIDADSNANCDIDGVQRENLVYWQTPPRGRYVVYADLFDSCGQGAVSFEVTPYVSRPGKPAADGTPTFQVVALATTAGTLMAANADQGTKLGTYVTELQE
jgi:hypothetical protein